MQKKAFIFFVLTIISVNIHAVSIIDTTLESYIVQEKYANAFKHLENYFKKPNTNLDTLSFYFFKTSDCLFKTRTIEPLNKMLQLIDKYNKLITPYYLEKMKVIKLNYLRENGALCNDLQIKEALYNCNYTDIKKEWLLLLALWQINNNETIASKKNYEQIFYDSKSDTIQKAFAANGIGACFTYESNYDSAKIYYSIAQNLFSKKWNTTHTKVAQSIYNIALIEIRYGNYATAEKITKEALAIYIAKLGECHTRTAEAYGELGSIYFMQDNLEKALYYILKEGSILEKLYNGNNTDIVYSLLNSGKVYYFLNDLLKAETQLQKGIDILKKHHQTQNNTYIQLTIELAKVLHKKQQYIAAENLLMPIIKNNNYYKEDKADAYIQLGTNYAATNKTKEAIQAYQTAIHIFDEVYGINNVYSIQTLISLSEVYLQNNEVTLAYTIAKEATNRSQKNNQIIFPYNHWECAMQEMQCKKKLYLQNTNNVDIKKEIEYLKQIVAEANKIKQTYYSTGSRQYYAEKMTDLNELGVYYVTKLYKKLDTYAINSLLFFTENNKANLLHDKLINQYSNEILPAQEQAKSIAITDRLNYFYALNENQEQTAFNVNDSILYYQNLYEDFSKFIEKKYPKIYQLKYGNTAITVQEIQQKLNNQSTFLTYCNDGQDYYSIAITKEKISFKYCGNTLQLTALAKTYLQSILNKNANDSLAMLLCHKIIPQDLKQNIIVSEDNTLQNIPFDALRTDNSTYLLQQHTIAQAFSAYSYFNYPTIKTTKKVITFFPDFSQTNFATLNNKQEHESLKTYAEYAVFYKEAATKNQFMNATKYAGIIHIASHLLIDTLNPLRSALVFQPNKDYLLTIQEIWKLKTNCQLVTLAACESNFGKTQTGEGVQNFAWAFYYAGAQHILSTNWNAADKSTATIAAQFYNNLHKGKPASEALQNAKLNYLKNADAIGAQPYYWAQLSLIGNANAINMSPTFLTKYWWILSVLFFFIFVLIMVFRKYIKKNN